MRQAESMQISTNVLFRKGVTSGKRARGVQSARTLTRPTEIAETEHALKALLDRNHY